MVTVLNHFSVNTYYYYILFSKYEQSLKYKMNKVQ